MAKRKPAAAGGFYPADPKELRETLKGLFSSAGREQSFAAAISPHAGYAYSGRLSALSASRLEKAGTIVILGTGHTGLGAPIAVSNAEAWETPLGSVEVDARLSGKIVENSSAEFDDLGHLSEHSIEVQLPFLQFLFPEFKIIAVALSGTGLEGLLSLGKAIAGLKAGIAVLASGDFSHYIPLKAAEERDLEAIRLIEALKAEEFHSLVQEKNLSICGLAPFTALVEYCRKKGLKSGKLLEYTTSAETTGDGSSVVGYASVVFG